MQLKCVGVAEAAAVSATIEHNLLASLAASNTQARNASFTLEARDDAGALIGGLVASTAYGWLHVKALWVRDDQRGRGVGRRLMVMATDRGRELVCHGVWLDTSSPAARSFYLALDFVEFGQLANATGQHPSEHRRWFLRRDL